MSDSIAKPKEEQAVPANTAVESKGSAGAAQNGANGSAEQVEGEKKPSKKGGKSSPRPFMRNKLMYISQEGG